jgi:WD40 repeat protein
VLGELPDEAAGQIAGHLVDCPLCESAAASVDGLSDPVVLSLRRAVRSSTAVADTPAPCGGTMVDNGATAPKLENYEVLTELGRGGMGIVYRANDRRLGRVVALKLIKAGTDASQELRDRFRREATAMARLLHPGIVQVFEIGEQDRTPFLAMELVEGDSLAARLGGAPLAARPAAELLCRLAEAVAYAHQHEVLHRDLTPANVLLTKDGTPKISDFGLARLMNDPAAQTRSGAIMGTPNYLSPEQADGKGRAVGPAADLYALGAILYECLTGRPPFQAATVLETLAQVVRDEPVSPSQLLPQMPRDLGTICLKCLRKEPGQRYGSAQELVYDLTRFLSGRPIHARPVGTAERVWRWGRRNPGWAAMLTTAAVLLLATAIGATWMNVRLNDAVRNGEHRLWESYLAQARATRLTGRPGQRFESLAAICKALALPVPPGHSRAELRDEAIACLVLADLEPADDRRPLVCPAGEFQSVPDHAFTRYATLSPDGCIHIRRMTDGAEIACLRDSSATYPGGLFFSPDDRFLAHRNERERRVTLWRLDGPEPTKVRAVLTGVAGASVAFNSDNTRLAIVHEKSIAIYDAATMRDVRRIATNTAIDYLAFSPDPSHLAAAIADSVQVFDIDSGAVIKELPHPNRVRYVTWHPTRRVVATTCDDLKIRVWDVDREDQLLPPLEGHQTQTYVFFNRAGDRFISNDWDGMSRLWDLQSGRLLLATTSQFCCWHFSPDNRYLAVGGLTAAPPLLRVAPGREVRMLAELNESPGGIVEMVASPDDRLLAVRALDRQGVAFIDKARGIEVGAIPTPQLAPLTFEPGGALLTHGKEKPIQRWPIRTDAQTGIVHIGPPQTIWAERAWERRPISSPDARMLCLPGYTHTLILRRPDEITRLEPCEDARRCAISPDGRWAATGNHSCVTGIGAQVWDLHANPPTEAKRLPVGDVCDVGFSGNGRWLVTTGGGYRLWHVDSWEEGPPIAQARGENGAFARFAFAPDSKLLALAGGVGQVRLVRPDTGALLARLSIPEQTVVQPCRFSADGSELTAIGANNRVMYTWDLRAIRAQLRELDLDWEAPDYPPPSPPAPAVRVQVLLE